MFALPVSEDCRENKSEVLEVMFQSLKTEAFCKGKGAITDLHWLNNVQECYRKRHNTFRARVKFHAGFPTEHHILLFLLGLLPAA